MSIKTELAGLLTAALQDIRCVNPRLILEQLFKRENHGGGIPEHRVVNLLTGIEVTSMEDLLAEIKEDNITIQVTTSLSSSSFKDKCKPVKLILSNLEVTLYPESPEDAFFNHNVSSYNNRICFVMGYVSDNDTVLPLKLIDVYLVGNK